CHPSRYCRSACRRQLGHTYVAVADPRRCPTASCCGTRRAVRFSCQLRGASSRFSGLWSLFFFSSRRRHTRSLRDWSSDVCSSDLLTLGLLELVCGLAQGFRLLKPAGFCCFLALFLRPLLFPPLRNIGDLALCWFRKIGRASCRERVWIAVGAGSVEERRQNVGGSA